MSVLIVWLNVVIIRSPAVLLFGVRLNMSFDILFREFGLTEMFIYSLVASLVISWEVRGHSSTRKGILMFSYLVG